MQRRIPSDSLVIHRRLAAAAALLTFALAGLAAAPAAAQVSTSGKNVAALDGEFDAAVCLPDVAIGTIAKGQKGAILTVHVTAYDIVEGTVPRIFRPTVNGVNLNGPASVDGQVTSEFDNSAVSGVWWITIAQAEEQQPGTIVGKPLEIEIDQLCTALGAAPYRVTAVAQQTKN